MFINVWSGGVLNGGGKDSGGHPGIEANFQETAEAGQFGRWIGDYRFITYQPGTAGIGQTQVEIEMVLEEPVKGSAGFRR